MDGAISLNSSNRTKATTQVIMTTMTLKITINKTMAIIIIIVIYCKFQFIYRV